MSNFHVLIPARLESQRLPNKPLADLAGLPLIVRVWQQACNSNAASVHVATDSEQIAEAVHDAGGDVVMTQKEHDSGTSRLAEVAAILQLDDSASVVNVQGDEPAMPPVCIDQVAELLLNQPQAQMATLWQPIDDPDQWQDANVVKLVTDAKGFALYFSRAPIPHRRGKNSDCTLPDKPARRHIGLYAYRAGALNRWNQLPESALAEAESLEQLRALDAGWKIVCAEAAESIPPGVDTAEDLESMRVHFVELENQRHAGASS
ncbi:MAG: 3-deoxy-manno-octulosonate cytidylyltransferase [Pseudomonadota bacterium]